MVQKLGSNFTASKIASLGVENIDVMGRNNVGGLAGYVQHGSVVDCHTTGMVSGRARVGGVVGFAKQAVTMSSTYSTATVIGTSDDIGGLVGQVEGGRITSSYAIGAVKGGARFVGGLVGRFNFGSVQDVYATGDVEADQNGAGGLFGASGSCVVINAFAIGNVMCTAALDSCGPVTGGRNSSALPIFNNVFHSSTADCVNNGTGDCNAGEGGGVDLDVTPTYFQDSSNEPLASWENNWDSPTAWAPRIRELSSGRPYSICWQRLGDMPRSPG